MAERTSFAKTRWWITDTGVRSTCAFPSGCRTSSFRRGCFHAHRRPPTRAARCWSLRSALVVKHTSKPRFRSCTSRIPRICSAGFQWLARTRRIQMPGPARTSARRCPPCVRRSMDLHQRRQPPQRHVLARAVGRVRRPRPALRWLVQLRRQPRRCAAQRRPGRQLPPRPLPPLAPRRHAEHAQGAPSLDGDDARLYLARDEQAARGYSPHPEHGYNPHRQLYYTETSPRAPSGVFAGLKYLRNSMGSSSALSRAASGANRRAFAPAADPRAAARVHARLVERLVRCLARAPARARLRSRPRPLQPLRSPARHPAQDPVPRAAERVQLVLVLRDRARHDPLRMHDVQAPRPTRRARRGTRCASSTARRTRAAARACTRLAVAAGPRTRPWGAQTRRSSRTRARCACRRAPCRPRRRARARSRRCTRPRACIHLHGSGGPDPTAHPDGCELCGEPIEAVGVVHALGGRSFDRFVPTCVSFRLFFLSPAIQYLAHFVHL
jgi:hypothetical protein